MYQQNFIFDVSLVYSFFPISTKNIECWNLKREKISICTCLTDELCFVSSSSRNLRCCCRTHSEIWNGAKRRILFHHFTCLCRSVKWLWTTLTTLPSSRSLNCTTLLGFVFALPNLSLVGWVSMFQSNLMRASVQVSYRGLASPGNCDEIR